MFILSLSLKRDLYAVRACLRESRPKEEMRAMGCPLADVEVWFEEGVIWREEVIQFGVGLGAGDVGGVVFTEHQAYFFIHYF